MNYKLENNQKEKKKRKKSHSHIIVKLLKTKTKKNLKKQTAGKRWRKKLLSKE